MKIEIQSPGLAPNPQLETFIMEEMERFFHLYREIVSCEVCLSLDSSSAQENKSCRIRLLVPGNDLLATARCSTFEEAIAQSAEAVEKQIAKRKTKTERVHKRIARSK